MLLPGSEFLAPARLRPNRETTDNSDFAKSVFRCPTRIQENHWRRYKEYPGFSNPWKISYAMNQHTLISFPPGVTSPKTVKLTSIRKPAESLATVDVSYELNHPAVIYLGKTTEGYWDIGYKHGAKHPNGKANIIFFDNHLTGFGAKQTNQIIMNFKAP